MIGASPYPQPFGSPIVGLQGIPKHIPPKPKEDLRHLSLPSSPESIISLIFVS